MTINKGMLLFLSLNRNFEKDNAFFGSNSLHLWGWDCLWSEALIATSFLFFIGQERAFVLGLKFGVNARSGPKKNFATTSCKPIERLFLISFQRKVCPNK